MLTPNGGQPVLYENYNGELIDWDKFFENRDKHIELMKNGDSISACKDCLWIKDEVWGERKKEFKYILINIWTKCNLFCVYCSNHTDFNVLNNTKEYNLIPVLKDMIEKGVLTANTKIDIAGGESTLDPYFNELLALLIDNGVNNININTNATIYSESIKKGIEKGVVTIITSIDAGTPKKFAFIKKKNLWKKVWSNLEKYSASKNKHLVRAKYIILPGINDSKNEIEKFIIKAKNTGLDGVILNIDLHWLRKNSNDVKTMKHIISLTKHFIKISSYFNIEYQVWAHIEDLIKRYNILEPENKIDIDFIFEKNQNLEKITILKKIKLVIYNILSFI